MMRTFGLFVLALSLLIVGESFATPINSTEKEPVVTADSEPTSTYTNNIILPAHDFYQLYWNHTNETITFEVHVRDVAWVLFGLKSESYSDVIVAAVFEDGTGHFSERVIGNTNYTLTPKPTHNWRLLDAFKRNNSTVVKFSRSIKLDCLNNSATPHVGIDITTGRNRLVLATGSKFDRTDNSITIAHLYSKRVQLLSNVTSESQLGCLRYSSQDEEIRFESKPTEEYANQIDLVPGVYRVYWNVTETNLTAEVHVRTKSWIGFGFSPSGGMIGSNVVIGYIMPNGSVHFSERHITVPSVSGITLTRNQTAHLLAHGRLNEYVYFKFTRLINVCDSEHVSIKKGTPHLIYAFGEEPLGPGDDISYHGFANRGSLKVNMISLTNSDTPIPQDTHYVDFSIKNVILPKVETFYYSQLFEVPKSLTKKRHIYMIEVLTSEVNRKNIHHMIVFECPSTYMGHPGQSTHNSFTDIVTSRICKTASFGWATGSEPKLFLPSTTGYPIGGDTDYSHFVVEVHYNNPELEIGYIDSITLRYHLTEQLRPNELGMLTVGTLPSSHAIVLPPNANKFTLETFCHSTCIKYAFDQNPNMTNITIVGSLLHTHMAGIAVETKIIRNGIDMGYIFGNDLYDYNYQQTYMLKPFVNITKDDELIHRCTYSTTGRQSFTLGGFAAKEEMCYNFMLYYPRGWFRNCSSVPYLNDYVDFLNDLSKSGDLKLDFKLNYNHRNLSYGIDKAVEQLVGHPVASRVKNHLVHFFNTTRVSELCGDLIDLGPKERLVPVNKQLEPNVCV